MKINKVEKNKPLITEVKSTEESANTKSFDYYYKRALTRREQKGENIPGEITPNELYEMRKKDIRGLSFEKRRVREFKKEYRKTGHEVYEKELKDTDERQEKENKEDKDKSERD